MFKKPSLVTVFLVVFIGLLGFSFILPLVPFFGDRYGLSDAVIGLLIAAFSTAQLIGTPLLGRLSDVHGRKPILAISAVGTTVALVVFGLADPIGRWAAEAFGLADPVPLIVGILFASRIVDGLTGGNISVAQAYITDETTPEERSKGLALIGVAFGLGFIFGPATSGFLASQFGLSVPAFVAAGISLVSLGLILFKLPESLSEEERAANLSAADTGSALSLSAIRQALNKPLVGSLIATTFFFLLAFALLQGVFVLYALRRFGINETQAGLFLTYVGVIAVIVQGGLVGPLTDRISEWKLIVACTAIMGVSLLGWALAGSIAAVLVVLTGVAFSGGLMNTILRSTITKVADKRDAGSVLGVQSSAESLTRAISPVLGGWLIGAFGTAAPGILGFVELMLLLPFVYVWFIKRREGVGVLSVTEGAADR